MSEHSPLSPVKQALLAQALARRRQAARTQVQIPRRASQGPAPLSFAQQRMWFLQQWEPGSATFNGARALRLRGALDRDALEQALRGVIERHESLRTVVVPGSVPLQRAIDADAFVLEIVPGPGSDGEHELDRLLRELSRRPFDLTSDLMLRASLVELGAREHVLLLAMHHIAADAHSDGILFAELAALYEAHREGRAAALPDLPIQYADYALWQNERLQGRLLEELRAYWTRTLQGAPELLRLPLDHPRPPLQRHRGAHHRFALQRRLAEGLAARGREQGATFYMAMLAAFATFLYRLSGERDVVIGSPIANRNNVELEGLIGFFTNTIALRIGLDGNPSFREVLERTRAVALGAYAHQELPFEKVVETLAPRRDPGYNPLFQVNFRAQASTRPTLALSGIEVEPVAVDIGFSRFDLALEVEAADDALRGYIEYDQDLFELSSIESFEQRLRELLAQVVDEPDVPVLTLAFRSRRPSGHSIRRRGPG